MMIKEELRQYVSAEKAQFLPRFFQAFPGGYGEGDHFLGVTVPNQRKVAKKYYRQLSLAETEELLNERHHEYRLTALFIMVLKYDKATTATERTAIVNLYLNNLANINNWDLVDSSADKLLGPHLLDKEKDLLYTLAKSQNLWEQRISIMTTFHFIRNGQYHDTLQIAEILLSHEHDLIHKAVGWMLREVGNRDFETEFSFLERHYRGMPRTMLRYAIEKFEPELRQKFLKGLI